MDETTQKALNEFVQQVISAAQTGAQWTAEQAPLVVQEWLRWQLIEALLLGCLGVVVLVFAAAAAYCAYRWSCDYETEGLGIIAGAVAAILIAVGATLSSHFLLVALKVYVAPRVVVLEKFAELVK